MNKKIHGEVERLMGLAAPNEGKRDGKTHNRYGGNEQ